MERAGAFVLGPVQNDRGAQRHVNTATHGDYLHVCGRGLVIGADRPAGRHAPAALDRVVVVLVVVVSGFLGAQPAYASGEQNGGEEEQPGGRGRGQVTSLHDVSLWG